MNESPSASQPTQHYTVNGRRWIACDPAHAIEQHIDSFPDEPIAGKPTLTTIGHRDYVVTVRQTTPAEAAQVMAERLGHDEDYGFPYSIEYANTDALPVSITVGDEAAALPFEVFRSDSDGALVVQLDTDEAPGRIRLYVNEGAVYDGDPEHDENPVLITRRQLQKWVGEPVSEELIAAMREIIAHSPAVPDAIRLIAKGVRERGAAIRR